MKACGVSSTAKDVTLLELTEPPSPGPGQILVAVEAAGVGPWDELVIDAGWDVRLRPRRRWEWKARAGWWPSARVSPDSPWASRPASSSRSSAVRGLRPRQRGRSGPRPR